MFQKDGRCVCLCEIKQWLTATSKPHGVWKRLRGSVMKIIRDRITQDEQTSAVKHLVMVTITHIQGEFKVHGMR